MYILAIFSFNTVTNYNAHVFQLLSATSWVIQYSICANWHHVNQYILIYRRSKTKIVSRFHHRQQNQTSVLNFRRRGSKTGNYGNFSVVGAETFLFKCSSVLSLFLPVYIHLNHYLPHPHNQSLSSSKNRINRLFHTFPSSIFLTDTNSKKVESYTKTLIDSLVHFPAAQTQKMLQKTFKTVAWVLPSLSTLQFTPHSSHEHQLCSRGRQNEKLLRQFLGIY